ncbi:MAG: hypothetical protein ABEJ55_06220 [Halanaeroarchaeum sp.]
MATGPTGRFGESVERLVTDPRYPWVQRAVVTATALLLLANGLLRIEAVAVGPGVASVLWAGLQLGVLAFVLTGALQVVAMGRRFDRGAETVQRAADDLERAATDVEETAEELDAVSDTVETVADAIDETAATTAEEPPMDPEAVEEVAETVDQTADAVRERTDEALSRAEKAKRETERVTDGTPSAIAGSSASQEPAADDET